MMEDNYILKPYDDQLRFILENGYKTKNRTNIDCLTVFGTQARYRIDDRFPILTGRRLKPQAIFAELLWFLSGSTNIKDLQQLNSHIWDDWNDIEWQRNKGFVEGSLGPVYGFNLRSFGGFYGVGEDTVVYHERDSYSNYTRKYGEGGIDQLSNMVKLLKSEPESRRNLFILWNPVVLKDQKLPPCHLLFQLHVHDGKLSGSMYQRSCDAYLGHPSNIYSYSTLLYMLAQQTGLQPYEFIHTVGDHHIYENHIDQVQKYLERPKPSSPRLRLNKAKDIFSYRLEDFVVEDYNPLPPIKAPIAV